jgi:hypothetical protein
MRSSLPGTEFTPGGISVNLNVQAFLILERVAGSGAFEVSALLRAGGRFIGKTSLGTVAPGQEILLSLDWDQPSNRFVVSSQVAGSLPVLSFIPFVWPGVADALVPLKLSIVKSFVLNSDVTGNSEAHENKN